MARAIDFRSHRLLSEAVLLKALSYQLPLHTEAQRHRTGFQSAELGGSEARDAPEDTMVPTLAASPRLWPLIPMRSSYHVIWRNILVAIKAGHFGESGVH